MASVPMTATETAETGLSCPGDGGIFNELGLPPEFDFKSWLLGLAFSTELARF